MKSYPMLTRWLGGIITGAVFAGILLVSASRNSARQNEEQGQPAAKKGGDEWIMYGGTTSRNMISPNAKNLPAKWDIDTRENVLWDADLGSKAYGGPTIAGGRIIIGTNNQAPRQKSIVIEGKNVSLMKLDEKTKKQVPMDLGVLMCFNQKDGAYQWQQIFFKLSSGQVNDWPYEGICSSPVVEGDKLYYVNNRCEVVCATLDGKLDKNFGANGRFDMMGKLGVFPHNPAACSPLIVGDKLWLVTANGINEDHTNVPAPRAPNFLALDKKTGAVLWQNNFPTAKLVEAGKTDEKISKEFFKRLVNRGELIQHGQWSNPAYAKVNGQDQVIFPGGDGWLYSFDTDGKLLWKFDCNPKDALYELAKTGTRSDFIATPVIYDNKVYIGVGQDPEHEFGVGHLWCIRMDKRGDVSPELVTDDSVWPPKTKPNPESAKIWHFGGHADAKKVGRNYHFGRTMSTCAIKDDLVYISELQGQLHCLDAKTGEKYWT